MASCVLHTSASPCLPTSKQTAVCPSSKLVVPRASRVTRTAAASGGLDRGVVLDQTRFSSQHSPLTDEGDVLRGSRSHVRGRSFLSGLATVEVKFHLTYKANFGEQLYLVGDSPILGSWDVTRATQLRWSESHIWSAVVQLPTGSNLEYKYIVANSSRTSVRWQDGPNCELRVSSRGGLLEVQDSWGHETRVRRELGLPAAAAAQGFAAPCEVPADISFLDHSDDTAAAASASAAWQQQVSPATKGYKSAKSVVDVINLPVASVATLDEPGQSDYPLDFLSGAPADSSDSSSNGAEDYLDFASALVEEAAAVFPEGTAAGDVAALLPGMDAELLQALDDLVDNPSGGDVLARQTLEEGLRVLQQLQQQHEAMLSVLRPSTPEPSMTSSSSSKGSFKMLESHDELADALLSDDCVEACNCMVDALCACQAANEEFCYCPEPHATTVDSRLAPLATAATESSAAAPAAAAVSCPPPLSPLEDSQQQQQVQEVQYEIPAEDSQQLMSLATVAADVAAQERRLEDVQAAIDRSMALLDQLRDPTHPLVLAADRGLAMAHRGSAQVRLSVGNTVRGHLWVPSAGAV